MIHNITEIKIHLAKPLPLELEVKSQRRIVGTVKFQHGSPIIAEGKSIDDVFYEVGRDMIFLLREYGDAPDEKLSPGARKFKREIRGYFK